MTRRIDYFRKRRLGDEDDPLMDDAQLTPAERLSLVWELTKTALAFSERTDVEPRLQRSLVRFRRLRG